MEIKEHHIIACSVLAPELKSVIKKHGMECSTRFFEGGLHEEPGLLRTRLQEAIDEIDMEICRRVSIGYGICGHGTTGIHSRGLTLAIPRVHDCISLFLGSDRAYREEFKKYPGTFYLTEGWCSEKIEIGASTTGKSIRVQKKEILDALTEKYGRENAKEITDFFSSWQKNYQRAVYIDTGTESVKVSRDAAREMAEEFNWKYESLRGSTRLLDLMLTETETTDEILIVPPGMVTGFEAAAGRLTARDEHSPGGNNKRPVMGAFRDSRESDKKWKVRVGLGIDAGGTYTDAVLYDFKNNEIIESAKALTTRYDYTTGIREALTRLSGDSLAGVELVSLSTTLATNAIVEGKGEKVGLFIMTPYGIFKPEKITHEPRAVLTAQMDMDGREIAPVVPGEVKKGAKKMLKAGVKAFAVSGYAGVRNPEHEQKVKSLLAEMTGLPVTCGHELSDLLDYCTRANTAVYNAMIVHYIERLLADLEQVLEDFSIAAPVVVVKGDGTLMSSARAKERPVETILSGPAASAAGALHLTGLADAVVVDIGGTTTDCGIVEQGLVRIRETGSLVGSFRTHVRALDIRTSGLGGDSSIIRKKDEFSIGPNRVAPVACLGSGGQSLTRTLSYLEKRLDNFRYSTEPMQVLALERGYKEGEQSPGDREITGILSEYPHSVSELSEKVTVSLWSLSLQRMIKENIVQIYNLTPTDLLHASGRFTRWDEKVAGDMCRYVAEIAKVSPEELVDLLLEEITNRLSRELIKQQVSLYTGTETMDSCGTCTVFTDHMLNEEPENFDLTFTLKKPVIGIGAPVHFFLPGVGRKLNTEVIIPENAAVANAVGAITSRVVVKKEMRIVPTMEGAFTIEGLKLEQPFGSLDEAQEFLEGMISEIVIETARAAGTSETGIDFIFSDSIVDTAYGESIFLSRTVSAELTGMPDLVLPEKLQ